MYRRIGKLEKTRKWRQYIDYITTSNFGCKTAPQTSENVKLEIVEDKWIRDAVNQIANIIGSSGDTNSRYLAKFYLWRMLKDVGKLPN